ncbi:MAG: FmdB family zinc ribbon protein [Granulosicoccus sp.]
MPVYQYNCESCGHFDKSNPMSMASERVCCPRCKVPASRFIAAPFLASSSRSSIRAAGLNEVAQNEPRHSAGSVQKHNPGCGCCGGGSSRISGKTAKNAAGDKMFPTKRPWMISH